MLPRPFTPVLSDLLNLNFASVSAVISFRPFVNPRSFEAVSGVTSFILVSELPVAIYEADEIERGASLVKLQKRGYSPHKHHGT